jgi:hypothetical protein
MKSSPTKRLVLKYIVALANIAKKPELPACPSTEGRRMDTLTADSSHNGKLCNNEKEPVIHRWTSL